ncbi:protein of unknown function [Paraburkholderia kururiensis]
MRLQRYDDAHRRGTAEFELARAAGAHVEQQAVDLIDRRAHALSLRGRRRMVGLGEHRLAGLDEQGNCTRARHEEAFHLCSHANEYGENGY